MLGAPFPNDWGARILIFHTLLFVVAGLAWWSRERRAQQAAAIWVVACLLSDIATTHSLHYFRRFEPALFAIDLAALLALSALLFTNGRRWLLWAVAFQLCAVGAHFVAGGDFGVRRWVYQVVNFGAGWGTTVAIGAGALTALRRRRRPNSSLQK